MPKSTSSTSGKSAVSGTTENFSFGSGRTYASAAEYARETRTFAILEIVRENGGGFEGKDRWLLTVKAEGRDPEYLGLGCNPKRDDELAKAQTHLAGGGTITNKRLRLSGGAYYLVDGDR